MTDSSRNYKIAFFVALAVIVAPRRGSRSCLAQHPPEDCSIRGSCDHHDIARSFTRRDGD